MQQEIGDYIYGGTKIGTGSFAEVFKGYHKTTGRVVAVKVVDLERLSGDNNKLRQHLDSEISIMKSLDHVNIAKLFDVFVSDKHVHMILEYCDGGDFSKYIQRHKRLSESRAKFFMQQLASGLRFLRQKDIIHRDLKPQNLLLADTSDKPVLKISDFGFARFIGTQSLAATLCGSPLYMAPEILKLQNYSIKADLWSVGTILYEMLSGVPPWNVKNIIELAKVIETKTIKFPSNISVSPECLDLMYSLLKKDVTQRMSWEEFFMHPWLGFNTSQPLASSPSQYAFMAPSTSPQQIINPIPPSAFNFSPSPTSNFPHPSFGTSPQPVSVSPPSHYYIPANHTNHIPFVNSPTQQQNYFPVSGSSSRASPGTSPIPRSSSSGSTSKEIVVSRTKGPEMIASNVRIPVTQPFRGSDSSSFGSTSSPSTSAHSKSSSGENYANDLAIMGHHGSLVEGESITRSQEDRVVADIEAKGRRAFALAELGDIKAEADQPADALAIYVRALKVMHNTLLSARRLAQTYNLVASQRVLSVVGALCERFSECGQKVEYWRTVVRSVDAIPCVERLVYEHALNMGRTAGVDELWKNYIKSEAVYQSAVLLLEWLYREASDAQDRELLQNYLLAFSKRLHIVRKKMNSSQPRRSEEPPLKFV